MGYTTNFKGQFLLNKQLTLDDYQELRNFSEDRHEGGDFPDTGYCQWTPTSDGWHIEWDGGEKFYEYVPWLKYLIKNLLEPKGYIISGEVEWSGEESGDVGKILVVENEVTVKEGRIAWESTHIKCPNCGEGIDLEEIEKLKKSK